MTRINIKLFKPGTWVVYRGTDYSVDHILINSRSMMVRLNGLEDLVDAEHLELVPTQLTLKRTYPHD